MMVFLVEEVRKGPVYLEDHSGYREQRAVQRLERVDLSQQGGSVTAESGRCDLHFLNIANSVLRITNTRRQE